MDDFSNKRHLFRLHRSTGFTLIELSIVLVIIGLLVGGILAGNALIREAQIRNAISGLNSYIAGITTFQSKYNALPGDMVNATSVWGQADGGTNGQCANPDSDNANPSGTCNGNGNGMANYYNVSMPSEKNEAFRFWQQLSLAGLIKGTYTGTSDPSYTAVADVNVPTFSFLGQSAIVNISYFQNTLHLSGGVDLTRSGNGFGLNSPASASSGIPIEVAWKIDQKLDDGMPVTGRIWNRSVASTCTIPPMTSGAFDTTVIYDLTDANKNRPLCGLILIY